MVGFLALVALSLPSITVHVIDGSGQPVDGATVYLTTSVLPYERVPPGDGHDRQTNPDGIAAFGNLDPKTTRIRVVVYLDDRNAVEYVESKGGNFDGPITVKLRGPRPATVPENLPYQRLNAPQ